MSLPDIKVIPQTYSFITLQTAVIHHELAFREPTRIVVIWVKNVQTELMVEIYSKSLVRPIGKVVLMKINCNTN